MIWRQKHSRKIFFQCAESAALAGSKLIPITCVAGAAGSVAAMQNQGDWYIARNGEQGGPLTDREMQEFVRAGHLHSEDLIWRPGFDSWQRAGDISVFLQLLPNPPGETDPKLLKTLERPEDGRRPAKNGAASVPVSQKQVAIAAEAGLSRLSESEFHRVVNLPHEEEDLERARGLGAVVPGAGQSLPFQQEASLDYPKIVFRRTNLLIGAVGCIGLAALAFVMIAR
jgi:hypothetical protein